jgi:hypothetical protein
MRALRCLALLLLIVWSAGLDAAVPPTKLPGRVIDFSKLPPGTIFIIGDDAKDVLQQPGVIVLSPEKFKELLDQIDQLKKQANPDKPETPSRCRLTGRVDGDLVHLQAQFDFETRRKKALVALGCQKAWPTAAVLDDGKLPLLPPPGDDGFIVQVDQPGPHRLTLDLDLPVTTRGSKGSDVKGTDRGFEMGLPRAAITIVEALDLPDPVKEVRFGQRAVVARDLSSRNGQRKPVALGPVEKLEVSWKGPAPQRPTEPILTVQGQVDVRVDDTHVTTQADLLLKVESGLVPQWQIQAAAPPAVTVEAEGPAGDDRGLTVIVPAADAKVPIWTIKPRDPTAEPLKLRLRSRQPRVLNKALPIGPFAVLQAMRQHGQITISVPTELRPRFLTRGEVSQREVPDDKRVGNTTVAAFSYWNLPAVPANQLVPAPLDLTLEPIQGAIESSVVHSLRLADDGWRVTSEIEINPVRIALDRLDVEVPADYELRASPALIAEPDLEVKDAAKHVSVVKLTKKHHQAFKVILEGVVPLAEGKQALTIALPRPLPVQEKGTKLLDKGARLTASVPETMELLVARDTGNDTVAPGKREQSWRSERTPPRVELAWQPQRQELIADALVDVTLAERQVAVRQRLRFMALPDGTREVVLRSPDFPAGRVPTAERVTLLPRGPGSWAVAAKDSALTIDYALPLPEPEPGGRPRRVAVPLFRPEGATRCTVKVRVWSDSGVHAILAGGAWQEQALEVVPERDSLPILVLTGSGVNAGQGLEFPLALRLAEPPGTSLAAVAFDRALIQASLMDGGGQRYRARFLLHKINSRTLDIELPGSPTALGLEVWLNGKRISSWQTLDDELRDAESGRVARLRVEPELYRKPVVLELRYQLATNRDSSSRWQTTVQPPLLRGSVLAGRVRWQIQTPADRVVIATSGSAAAEQQWGLRHGLLAPRPAATAADLERWFYGGLEPAGAPLDGEVDWTLRNPELVAGQPVLGALAIIHFGQQTWLLSCSLLVVALGLALYFMPLPRMVLWAVLVVLGLAVLVAALLWPRTMPALLYGCQPGLVVLLVVMAVQWLLQRRYRRQLIFMPAFSRVMPGSSMPGSSIIRGSGSGQRRHEPSTVDAPPGALGAEVAALRTPGSNPG